MDIEFEDCLGKYSDSYEHGIEMFNRQLVAMRKSNIIQHSKDFDQDPDRQHAFKMGHGTMVEPVYDTVKKN